MEPSQVNEDNFRRAIEEAFPEATDEFSRAVDEWMEPDDILDAYALIRLGVLEPHLNPALDRGDASSVERVLRFALPLLACPDPGVRGAVIHRVLRRTCAQLPAELRDALDVQVRADWEAACETTGNGT